MDRNFITIIPNKNPFKDFGVVNVNIKELVVAKKQKAIKFVCFVNDIQNLTELDIIEQKFIEKFGEEIKFKFQIEYSKNTLTDDEKKLIVDRVIKDIKRIKVVAKSFLAFYNVIIDNDNVIIELKNDISLTYLMQNKIDLKIQEGLTEFGINSEVKFTVGDFEKEKKQLEEEIIKKEEVYHNNFEKIQKENIKVPKTTTSENKDLIYGREIKDKTISFQELEYIHPGDTCTLEGEVFSYEERDLRTEKILVTFAITDYTDSIIVKVFLKKNEKINLKKGMWVKVKGKKNSDAYNNNEEYIMASSIMEIEPKIKERVDSYPEKRVELHAHTKMSEMDAVVEVSDLISQAAKWGHKAIAITDHGVVHAFPAAYKAAKKYDDFKVILGCEIYLVDDEIHMVKNPKDISIEEETYVVFDIETTGFDPYNDKIIEIGAVKLKGNKIIDRYSTFINPERKIPEEIIKLTNITDDMVKDSPTIEEELPNFLKFVENATLVAHNASFDVGFITQKSKLINIDISPTVIDTLQWSRNIRKDKSRHGLKAICKDYGIDLDNHHRAVDDAEATAEVFKKFINIVLKEGAYKLNEVDSIFKNDIKNASTYHAIVLVKNRAGLKNLYELVSEAHINYFHRKPRVPKSLLRKLREGLIIGSACESGEVIQAYIRGKSKDEIEKLAEFYDYLEVQPRSNNMFMIENGSMKNIDELFEMNKYIYELGKKQNKLVVATGDVHYLNEEDNIYRKILLYGKGYKDFDSDNKLYFRTTDEMIQEFSYLGEDIAKEIVITNPNLIAEEIEVVKPVPDGFYPPKLENAEETVREMTYKRAYEIYGNPLPEIVEKRLERELNAIIGNGFSVLYLSAQKLVKESLDNGYLVGSRGSVGSSLVAFMMGITEVNALYPHYICPNCKNSEFMNQEGSGVDLPDKVCPKCGTQYKKDGHSIPFEVFMGFNGDKVPDIDLNFSGEYQSEIHRFTERLFGKENVFKAGTISTLAERNAYGYVKKYCEENNINLRSAEMTRLAKGCENVKKTTGQHPGGMIVVPKGHSIYEFCPVQKPANDQNSDSITTHYDYHVMDEQLVKLDILGHDDPTTIKLLQDYTGVDIYEVPLADKDTLKIFSSTESLGVTKEEIGSEVGTFGVPEFGTQFVRQMLLDTMPTTFAELVRISGLSHGTDVWLNNAQEFVRAGECTLSEVISVRDDIMNYLIDNGIEKGTAFKIMEFVRKGRPSKEPEQWEKYSQLMKEHGVKDWYIESCRRIKYMFPKGHAVAYVMMAMRIAYFKVHYPLAFYAAYLSRKAEDFNSDIMLKDIDFIKNYRLELASNGKLDVKGKAELALCEIIIEMNARGFSFLGIDVYKSDGFKFTIEDGKIRVPLIGLNGLGTSVVENIVKEREIGKFISYEDLKRRTKASQTVVDKLKEVNAIDGLNDTNQISLF